VTLEERKAWVDSCDYQDLLYRKRYACKGDPMQTGEMEKYFAAALRKKRKPLTKSQADKISKVVDKQYKAANGGN